MKPIGVESKSFCGVQFDNGETHSIHPSIARFVGCVAARFALLAQGCYMGYVACRSKWVFKRWYWRSLFK